MNTPIHTTLESYTNEVRLLAFKRGHLTARLEILDKLKTLDVRMISPEQLYLNIVALIGDIDTPTRDIDQPTKPETRGRKPKAKEEK